MKVKNNFTDILLFGKHTRERNKRFKSASSKKPLDGSLNRLAAQLHPQVQRLKITKVVEESPDIRTFRLVSVDSTSIAPFRAGQYLTLSFKHQGLLISRPYSISSAPESALGNGFYEVTIRKTEENSFFSKAAFDEWLPETMLFSSGPNGTFYYEPLRDSEHLVFIAGGSGITPFRSMIIDGLERYANLKITLFYGFNTPADEIFREEFNELVLKYRKRFTYVPVVQSASENWTGSKGFINLELIQNYVDTESSFHPSFFICGPSGLHDYMDKELTELNLEKKYIRRESYGGGGCSLTRQTYKLKVITRNDTRVIDAFSDESIVTALERAGLAPPVLCRSGDCGWCRSRLVEGLIETDDKLTGLRLADKKFGWIHPCVSFPASDITLEVPLNPIVSLL